MGNETLKQSDEEMRRHRARKIEEFNSLRLIKVLAQQQILSLFLL